jgi:branched-chain amino acid transport system ATP-binding protein
LFALRKVWKNFGKLTALKDVSLDFGERNLTAIIGPNGAGKTTLVNVTTGVFREDSGIIMLDGKQINKLSPNERVKLGIGRTFQIPKPFLNLTVRENVKVGCLFSKRTRRHEIDDEIDEIIKLLGLSSVEGKIAGELNTEERKLVDLGRALASKPRYLFMDEMGAGLAEGELISLSKLIKRINIEREISIVYVGHVMRLVKELESPIVVFSEGSPIFTGTYDEVISNDNVVNIYLGDRYAKSH